MGEFRPGGEPQRSEVGEFRHRLIQSEFRNVLTSREYELPVQTDGIMIVSGYPIKNERGEDDHFSPENATRVEFGITVAREIVAKRLNKQLDEVTAEDLENNAPDVILAGATEQLPAMQLLASEYSYPARHLLTIDNGSVALANTKTQALDFNADPRFEDYRHLTIITNDYHFPRLVRTMAASLRPGLDFTGLAVPHDQYHGYSVASRVKGEIRRIINYSSKGDIIRDIPEND